MLGRRPFGGQSTNTPSSKRLCNLERDLDEFISLLAQGTKVKFSYDMGSGFSNDLTLLGGVIEESPHSEGLKKLLDFFAKQDDPIGGVKFHNTDLCGNAPVDDPSSTTRIVTNSLLIICDKFCISSVKKICKKILSAHGGDILVIDIARHPATNYLNLMTFQSILNSKVVIVAHESFSAKGFSGDKSLHGLSRDKYEEYLADRVVNSQKTDKVPHGRAYLQYFHWKAIIVDGLGSFIRTIRKTKRAPFLSKFCLSSKSKWVLVPRDLNKTEGHIAGMLEFLSNRQTPCGIKDFVKGKRSTDLFARVLEEKLWESLLSNPLVYYRCSDSKIQSGALLPSDILPIEQISLSVETLLVPFSSTEACILKSARTLDEQLLENILCDPRGYLQVMNININSTLTAICDRLIESVDVRKKLLEEYESFIKTSKYIFDDLWVCFKRFCCACHVSFTESKSTCSYSYPPTIDSSLFTKVDGPMGSLVFYYTKVIGIYSDSDKIYFELSARLSDMISQDLKQWCEEVDNLMSNLLSTAKDINPNAGRVGDLIEFLTERDILSDSPHSYYSILKFMKTMTEIYELCCDQQPIIQRETLRFSYLISVKQTYTSIIAGQKNEEWEHCMICMEDWEEIPIHSIASCGHIFCHSCACIIMSKAKQLPVLCPMCKYELYFPAEPFIFHKSEWHHPHIDWDVNSDQISSKMAFVCENIQSNHRNDNVIVTGYFKNSATAKIKHPNLHRVIQWALERIAAKDSRIYKNFGHYTSTILNKQGGSILCTDISSFENPAYDFGKLIRSVSKIYFLSDPSQECLDIIRKGTERYNCTLSCWIVKGKFTEECKNKETN